MAAEMWLIMPTGTCTSWADTTEQEQISIIWLSLSWVWFQGEIKFSLSHPIVFSKTWESEITQSCPTLCNPMDCSLPRFSVHGIFQARIPEWVAISFSRGSSQPRDRTQVSCIVGRSFTVWATREVINLQSLVTTHTHTHTHTHYKIETLLMKSLLTDVQQAVVQLLHSSLESCPGNLIRKQVFSPVLALSWVH